MEKTVEQRLERVEVHLEHIQSDVSEIKSKLDGVDRRFDKVDQQLTDLKVGRAYERVWYLLMLAGLLTVMARAFKWI